MMIRSIRRLFGVWLLVAGSWVAWAPSAGAEGPGQVSALASFHTTVDEVGAGLHTCRHNDCPALEVNQPGVVLRDFCYEEGQVLGGTKWWDLVYNPTTGRAGWTNEHWLSYEGQTQSCPWASFSYPTGGAAQEGAGIHTCRHNTCDVLGFVNGNTVVAFCFREGQVLDGTKWWSLVYEADTGVVGWTNESWLIEDAVDPC